MMHRRVFIVGTAASTAAFAAPAPDVCGPIEQCYHEWRRRELSITGRDFEDEDVDWIDEPVAEALGMVPETPREFAALVLMATLNGFQCDGSIHQEQLVARAKAMLGIEGSLS